MKIRVLFVIAGMSLLGPVVSGHAQGAAPQQHNPRVAVRPGLEGTGSTMQQTGTYNPQLASITAPRFNPNATGRGPAWPNGPPEVGLSDIPFLTVGRGGDNK